MVLLATSIATAKRGGTFSLNYADVDVAATINFDSRNWSEGKSEHVSFTDRLTPDGDEGSWTGTVFLEPIIEQSQGVHVVWVGEDVTLEYSTDNDTWIPLVNRRTILEDVPTAGLMLFIRAEFLNMDSWLESIRLDLLADRTMTPLASTRPLSFFNADMDHESEHQLSFTDDSGATIADGGYITIEPDVEDPPLAIRTVEFWARFDDPIGYIVRYASTNYARLDAGSTFTSSGVTAYRNGVLINNGTVVPQDTWAHYVVVFPVAQTGPIKFGNNLANDNPLTMNIGHLAYYDYAFTAAQALRQYQLNVGTAKLVITDANKIKVTEAVPALEVYAYTWSIVTAE